MLGFFCLSNSVCLRNGYTQQTWASGTKGHETGRGRRRFFWLCQSQLSAGNHRNLPQSGGRPVTTHVVGQVVPSCPTVLPVLEQGTSFSSPACPGGGLGALTECVQVYILPCHGLSCFSLFQNAAAEQAKTDGQRGCRCLVPFQCPFLHSTIGTWLFLAWLARNWMCSFR